MLLGARQFFAARKVAPAWQNPYVTDGLVAMWDGEWNAGGGVHDANATVWKDLSGNGYDLTLQNGAHFDDWSLVTANRNRVSALLSDKIPYQSIEVCAFFDSSRNSSALICFGNATDNQIMLTAQPDTMQTYNGNYQLEISPPSNPRNTWAGTHSGSNHTAYVGGQVAVGTFTNNTWHARSGNFGLSGSSDYSSWNFVGNYYCIRLYSRALTAAEIAANYAVDKARFNLP